MVVSQRDETEQRHHLLHLPSIYSHFLATSPTLRWPYSPSCPFVSCTLSARLVAWYDAADVNTNESNKLINPLKTDG